MYIFLFLWELQADRLFFLTESNNLHIFGLIVLVYNSPKNVLFLKFFSVNKYGKVNSEQYIKIDFTKESNILKALTTGIFLFSKESLKLTTRLWYILYAIHQLHYQSYLHSSRCIDWPPQVRCPHNEMCAQGSHLRLYHSC